MDEALCTTEVGGMGENKQDDMLEKGGVVKGVTLDIISDNG